MKSQLEILRSGHQAVLNFERKEALLACSPARCHTLGSSSGSKPESRQGDHVFRGGRTGARSFDNTEPPLRQSRYGGSEGVYSVF